MGRRPVAFVTVIRLAITKTKSLNLLLEHFELLFVVVSHTDVLLDHVILNAWDIDETVSAIGQAFGNLFGIETIRLDAMFWYRGMLLGAMI